MRNINRKRERSEEVVASNKQAKLTSGQTAGRSHVEVTAADEGRVREAELAQAVFGNPLLVRRIVEANGNDRIIVQDKLRLLSKKTREGVVDYDNLKSEPRYVELSETLCSSSNHLLNEFKAYLTGKPARKDGRALGRQIDLCMGCEFFGTRFFEQYLDVVKENPEIKFVLKGNVSELKAWFDDEKNLELFLGHRSFFRRLDLSFIVGYQGEDQSEDESSEREIIVSSPSDVLEIEEKINAVENSWKSLLKVRLDFEVGLEADVMERFLDLDVRGLVENKQIHLRTLSLTGDGEDEVIERYTHIGEGIEHPFDQKDKQGETVLSRLVGLERVYFSLISAEEMENLDVQFSPRDFNFFVPKSVRHLGILNPNIGDSEKEDLNIPGEGVTSLTLPGVMLDGRIVLGASVKSLDLDGVLPAKTKIQSNGGLVRLSVYDLHGESNSDNPSERKFIVGASVRDFRVANMDCPELEFEEGSRCERVLIDSIEPSVRQVNIVLPESVRSVVIDGVDEEHELRISGLKAVDHFEFNGVTYKKSLLRAREKDSYTFDHRGLVLEDNNSEGLHFGDVEENAADWEMWIDEMV